MASRAKTPLRVWFGSQNGAKKMPVVHLTDVVVSRLKEPGTYLDATTPAFGIRVGKNRKTWIVIRGRERARKSIDRYPAKPLAVARKEARVLLSSPIEPQVKVPTFAEAVQQFYEIHVRTMSERTQYQVKRVINKYFFQGSAAQAA